MRRPPEVNLQLTGPPTQRKATAMTQFRTLDVKLSRDDLHIISVAHSHLRAEYGETGHQFERGGSPQAVEHFRKSVAELQELKTRIDDRIYRPWLGPGAAQERAGRPSPETGSIRSESAGRIRLRPDISVPDAIQGAGSRLAAALQVCDGVERAGHSASARGRLIDGRQAQPPSGGTRFTSRPRGHAKATGRWPGGRFPSPFASCSPVQH